MNLASRPAELDQPVRTGDDVQSAAVPSYSFETLTVLCLADYWALPLVMLKSHDITNVQLFLI